MSSQKRKKEETNLKIPTAIKSHYVITYLALMKDSELRASFGRQKFNFS